MCMTKTISKALLLVETREILLTKNLTTRCINLFNYETLKEIFTMNQVASLETVFNLENVIVLRS